MTFNLFESFFLMSLGITFALLLILFYHFKERIKFIENKTDNLFSLIQDLAEELKKPKYNKLDSGSPYNMLNHENNQYEGGSQFINNVALDQVLIGTDLKNFENNLEELDIKNEDDGDEDDDELSDFISDIDGLDDDNVDGLDDDNVDDLDDDNEDDLDDDNDDNDADNEDNDDDDENFEKITIPDIKVIKQESEMEPSHGSKQHINFKKMHVGDLRAIVIERGLCEDPSKLKKGELVELIKNSM